MRWATVLGAYDLDYRDHDRLGSARLGNTPLAEYSHGGKGDRVLKTDAGQSTVYHWICGVRCGWVARGFGSV